MNVNVGMGRLNHYPNNPLLVRSKFFSDIFHFLKLGTALGFSCLGPFLNFLSVSCGQLLSYTSVAGFDLKIGF